MQAEITQFEAETGATKRMRQTMCPKNSQDGSSTTRISSSDASQKLLHGRT